MLKALLARLRKKALPTTERIEPSWDMRRPLAFFREAEVKPLTFDGWRLKLDNLPTQGGVRHT